MVLESKIWTQHIVQYVCRTWMNVTSFFWTWASIIIYCSVLLVAKHEYFLRSFHWKNTKVIFQNYVLGNTSSHRSLMARPFPSWPRDCSRKTSTPLNDYISFCCYLYSCEAALGVVHLWCPLLYSLVSHWWLLPGTSGRQISLEEVPYLKINTVISD